MIPGLLVFSVFGFLGQGAYNSLDARQASAESSDTSVWNRLMDSPFSPLKKLSNDEYEDLMKERLIRIEAEISLIDDEVATLKVAQQKQGE